MYFIWNNNFSYNGTKQRIKSNRGEMHEAERTLTRMLCTALKCCTKKTHTSLCRLYNTWTKQKRKKTRDREKRWVELRQTNVIAYIRIACILIAKQMEVNEEKKEYVDDKTRLKGKVAKYTQMKWNAKYSLSSNVNHLFPLRNTLRIPKRTQARTSTSSGAN